MNALGLLSSGAVELKRRFRADIAEVETALRREWDPIGAFSDWPDSPARDEYDAYAPHILSMLYSGCSAFELANHLERLRTVEMGLAKLRSRDEETAKKLLALPLASQPEVPQDAGREPGE